ncbi:MAG: DegT/DnrJ/EryC1/StrS family aminotransferase [Solirubrobacterales bacterium]
MTVPFFELNGLIQQHRDEITGAIDRVLSSGHFILGPELAAFEQEFAAYCGAGHCVGVGNGLDALTLVLRAAGIGAGHDVLVPVHTFIATWLAVTACGATPVPVAVDRGSYTLDPDAIERAITPRTRAIIAVHLYGQPADMARLRQIADAHRLFLMEDAAQAHGAADHGTRTGALGHAAAFSFYPTKNLGALGDGGAVTTNDAALAERVRMLRNYGAKQKYHHDLPGVNSRLDEMQAAVMRVLIRGLDDRNAARQRIAARYCAAFADLPLALPSVRAGSSHVWHLFVVATDRREALAEHLRQQGIATLIHYPLPPFRCGAYEGAIAVSPELEALGTGLADTVLSLPLWPEMTDTQQDQVIAAVRSYFGA